MIAVAQRVLPSVVPAHDVDWVFSEYAEVIVEPFLHTTVMRDEVVKALVGAGATGATGATEATAATEMRGAVSHLPSALVFVDVTLGGGGHTEALLLAAPHARVIAFDRDAVARAAARERLGALAERVTFVAAPFSQLKEQLAILGIEQVDGLCADLGVSSPQLDEAVRGMSFRREGPIDMRMDTGSGETALELIASETEEGLANIIFRFGDERRSRRIARSLKRALADNDLATTLDLRRAIVRAVGPVRVGGVDPATRTFQALRIAVNGELCELESLLAAAPSVLRPGAPCAVISFHSLEDRLVKHAFRQSEIWDLDSRRPLVPTPEEVEANPRSRSAKLRVAKAAMPQVSEFSA